MKVFAFAALSAVALGFLPGSESALAPQAKKLLAAKTLKIKISMTKIGGSDEVKTMLLGKDNFFRIDSPKSAVVCDGKTIIDYNKAKKTYTKTEFSADAAKAAFGDNSLWLWSAFFNAKFTDSISSETKQTAHAFRGSNVQDYLISRKGVGAMTVMLDTKTNFVSGMTWKDKAGASFVVNFSDLNLTDKAPQDSLFAFIPPEGASEVVAAAPGEKLKYADIADIVKANCDCHSGAQPADGIELSSYDSLMNSRTVRASDSSASKLIRVIKSGKMPPKKKMANEDTDKLAKWIDDGAVK